MCLVILWHPQNGLLWVYQALAAMGDPQHHFRPDSVTLLASRHLT